MPEPIKQIKSNHGELGYERFIDNLSRTVEFERWLSEQWIPWSEDTKEKQCVKKFYDEMFTLFNRLQDEGDVWEIAWGQGLVTWQKDDVQIQRHVLVTPLELHFDAEKGVFCLHTTSAGTKIETDMMAHLDVPNIAKAQEIDTADLDPKNVDSVSMLLKKTG